MSYTAHIYRRADLDQAPAHHQEAIYSHTGPYVVVYPDNGWHEWGGGYNTHGPALTDARYLTCGVGTVHDHTKEKP